jgi:hypothetical protein
LSDRVGVTAELLARRMDKHLMASLAHLADACQSVRPSARGEVAALSARIDAGEKPSPAHYGFHFDLLDAIADSDLARIDWLLALIARSSPTAALSIASLDGPDLPAAVSDTYRRNIDGVLDRGLNLATPAAGDTASLMGRLDEALTLTADTAPPLFEEVRAFVRQVVLADEAAGAPHKFYGASTFLLWGAIFLNPARHPTALDVADTLVHESGHLLLFARSIDEPMTLNPRDARYRSPLRSDPRPMEGIFHAVFVTARMAAFYDALAQSPRADPVTRQVAADRFKENGQAFREGLATVRSDGSLTATGREVIKAAETAIGA